MSLIVCRPMTVVSLILLAIHIVKSQLPVSERTDCVAYDSQAAGRCTPIMECAPVMRLIAESSQPLPTNLSDHLNRLHCEGFYNYLPIVCCVAAPAVLLTPHRNTDADDPINDGASSSLSSSSPPVDRFNRTGAHATDDDEVALQQKLASSSSDSDEQRLISEHANLRLLPLDECGPITTEKISGGNRTQLFEYPWMVQLEYVQPLSGEHSFNCAGSLISEWFVLTAAHCLTRVPFKRRLVSVRLGEHDTTTDPDCQNLGEGRECAEPVQDVAVAQAIWHAQFDTPIKWANDIGLIRMARRVNLETDSVRPICLPVTPGLVLPNRVTIAGWGLTEQNKPSAQLLQAHVPLVDNALCAAEFLGQAQVLDTQLCAGGERGIDSCSGDSGGPMMQTARVRTAQVVQFGIVSFGRSTCSAERLAPAVYTRVQAYTKWILDRLYE